MRGFAISFVTLARVALPDSFLCFMCTWSRGSRRMATVLASQIGRDVHPPL
jgi:hypothetical protein